MKDFTYALKLTAIFFGAIVIGLATLSLTGPNHHDNCVGCCK